MRQYYRKFYNPVDDSERDLPSREYWRLVKLWDGCVVLGDIFTIVGTVWIVFSEEVGLIWRATVLLCLVTIIVVECWKVENISRDHDIITTSVVKA